MENDDGETHSQKERTFPSTVTIYHDGMFLNWDSLNRRPSFFRSNPADFHQLLSIEWGPYSSFHVSVIMKLAQRYGTSLGPSIQPEEVVKGNHLGDEHTELTFDEIFSRVSDKDYPDSGLAQIGSIKVTREAKSKIDTWMSQVEQRVLERHIKAMEEYGFMFGQPDQ
jgi:hypothetical protein